MLRHTFVTTMLDAGVETCPGTTVYLTVTAIRSGTLGT
jgi:hypothetical protein